MTELGSLAQSARQNHLRGARITFFVIGALTLAVNLFQFVGVEKLVDDAIQKEIVGLGPGMVADPVVVAEAREAMIKTTRIMCGALVALGALFIIFGFVIHSAPVPIVITGLVIYIACAAIFAVIDPTTLAQGIIFKIIVVVSLVKAAQAAVAHSREKSAGIEADEQGGLSPL